MKDQITMDDLEIAALQAKVKHISQEIDRRFKMVARMKRDRFAILIDRAMSTVNDVLNSNNEEAAKPFQVYMIGALILMEPDLFKAEVIDFCGDLCGYSPSEKKRTMTPEEELAAYKKRVQDRGLNPLFDDIK